MNKRGVEKKFNEIVKKIKKVEIQGAEAVAKKSLYAYYLIPSKRSKNKLLSLRPTEPLLKKVLDQTDKYSYSEIMNKLDSFQEIINKSVYRIIKSGDILFTHCHSSSVVKSFLYAKKKGKKFEVYNTETRPLYQGRKTAKELRKGKIKVTQFVDSAAMIALTKKQGTRKVNSVFLGADAITKEGVINKVGSGMISKIAYDNKIPVYIISTSWKYSPKKQELEKRSIKEIWKGLSRKLRIHIENLAFEFIPKKYITAIISEKEILSYDKFLRKLS